MEYLNIDEKKYEIFKNNFIKNKYRFARDLDGWKTMINTLIRINSKKFVMTKDLKNYKFQEKKIISSYDRFGLSKNQYDEIRKDLKGAKILIIGAAGSNRKRIYNQE